MRHGKWWGHGVQADSKAYEVVQCPIGAHILLVVVTIKE